MLNFDPLQWQILLVLVGPIDFKDGFRMPMSNAEKREKKRDHPVFEVQGFVIEKNMVMWAVWP